MYKLFQLSERAACKIWLPFAVLILILGGCAQLEKAAKIGATAATVPHCRLAVLNYLPQDSIENVGGSLQLLDESIDKMVNLVKVRPDVSYYAAVDLLLDVPNKREALTNAYVDVESEVIAVAAGKNEDVPQDLQKCHADIKAGWSIIKSLGPLALASDFLKTYGPMAKFLIVL